MQLRSITASDLEFIRRHRNEPDTRQWLENQQEISVEGQMQWFHGGGADRFRIIQSDGVDVALGRVALAAGRRFCSIGLDVFASYRGRGLAEPAFRRMMEEGLQFADVLDLWVFLANSIALRTYVKCGFVHDHSTEVKHFTRQVDGQLGLYPYVRMTYGA